MYATFHIRNHVKDHGFDPREALWCVFTVKKRPSAQLFDLHVRVRMQIFSWKDVSVYNLSHNFLCLGSTDMFPRSVSTTMRVHARVHTLKDRCLLTFWVTKSFLCVTLTYDTMLVIKFSIDKSKRCTTAWLNLRTLLSMQFFTYKVMSENSGLTHAKYCDACSMWKDVPLHNFLTYVDVFAWKCSRRSTCLHKTCHTIFYVVLDRHVSTQCVLSPVCDAR